MAQAWAGVYTSSNVVRLASVADSARNWSAGHTIIALSKQERRY